MSMVRAAVSLSLEGIKFRKITSDATGLYNCIAWAANDNTKNWWPSPNVYWPGKPKKEDRQPTLSEFTRTFASLGFTAASNPDHEPGVEKIALYGDAGMVSHAARQLGPDNWTSKCGTLADVEHSLDQMVTRYGAVIAILSRKRS